MGHSTHPACRVTPVAGSDTFQKANNMAGTIAIAVAIYRLDKGLNLMAVSYTHLRAHET